jgi:hypothetical protein
MLRHAFLSLLLGASVLALGCGRSTTQVADRSPVYPTTIVVSHDGTPVQDATVTLISVDGSRGAYGRTDGSGQAVITTFAPGDGALAGEHKVAVRKVETVTAPDPTESNPEGLKVVEQRRIIPQQYERFDTSGLTVVVTEGEDNQFQLELTD